MRKEGEEVKGEFCYVWKFVEIIKRGGNINNRTKRIGSDYRKKE
jgi:hypothetical protein